VALKVDRVNQFSSLFFYLLFLLFLQMLIQAIIFPLHFSSQWCSANGLKLPSVIADSELIMLDTVVNLSSIILNDIPCT